jgi:hypothetical protein
LLRANQSGNGLSQTRRKEQRDSAYTFFVLQAAICSLPLLDLLEMPRRRSIAEQAYLMAAQSAWNSRIQL